MLQQMLDFDRRVVGDGGKFGVQRLHNRHRVGGTVEEIRVAEGDVLRARGDLLANVFEHHVAAHHPEMPAVNRHHRTMPAQMLAAAARLRIGDEFGVAVLPQLGVALEIRQSRAIRRDERQPFERNRRRWLRPRASCTSDDFELAARRPRRPSPAANQR